jgi:translocator assembly and maintenance protein 41
VTVTRLIRISYGDYKLDTIPKGMAIPVPYKPVASQKAKGSLHEQRPQRISTTKNSEKASPITWVSSVSTASSFHRNLFSLRKSNRRGFHTVSRDEGTGQLATREVLRDDILSLFPQDNLVYSFGYGSGVFSQTLKNSSKKHKGMLDLILVVDDTFQFHETNLQAVPSHYASWLRWGGPNLITRIQRQFPLRDAHVLFHVVDDPVPMKYGVVDLQDLLRDLNQWESLYLAGRLHKPTLPLLSPPDAFVEAQNQNLHAAVAASLILLMLSPETRHDVDESSSSNSSACSWASLFRSIASLSYTGDFRMQFGGEDPQKLEKLVQSPGQFHRFQTLYRPVLQSFEDAGVLSPTFVTEKEGDDDQAFYDSGIAWNGNDPSTLSYLYNHLPRNIRNQAVLSKEIPNHKDSTVVATNLAEALSGTVAPAARHQSFKGIFTLGFRRSIQYASAKLSKGLFRR